MPTLYNRQRIGRPRPHGLSWADIESGNRPRHRVPTPTALALLGAVVSGALVGAAVAALVLVLL